MAALTLLTSALLRNASKTLQGCSSIVMQHCNISDSSSSVTVPPHNTGDDLPTSLISFPEHTPNRSPRPPRACLVESLSHSSPIGLVSLHPEVFSQLPLLHIILENTRWQQRYKHVNMTHALTRGECRGSGRKPWPQKGTGRARHGSLRSPLFTKGGKCHGPQRFTTSLYMLPLSCRILGLTSTLSTKFAQDDIKIVDSLALPTDDKEYIQQLVDDRTWGPSVLFVDDTDVMPENISLATDNIGHMTLMPVYGLNVFSMLKHATLVLTLDAVRKIEERLIHNIYGAHRITHDDKFKSKTFLL